MKIKNLLNQPFRLTANLLTEATTRDNNPYQLRLKEINPKLERSQSVPYTIVNFPPQTYLATVVIMRSTSGRVEQIRIGCQTFVGENARAILKAVKAARAKTKKTKK